MQNTPKKTRWHRLFVYILFSTSLSGFLLYVFVWHPHAYTRALFVHFSVGMPCFLALCVFLYAQTRALSKKIAFFFAFYPFLSVLSLQTPTPLVFTFIFNITVVPLWIYLKLSENMDESERASFILKFLVLFTLCCAVISGTISLMDPIGLKFSSFFRKVHGIFIFLFANTSLYVFFAARNRPLTPTPKPQSSTLTFFALLVVVSFAESYLFTVFKNVPIRYSYAHNTYSTKNLSDKDKKPFKKIPHTLLNKSEDCHFCHKIPFEQWKISTHAYAGKNKSFLKVLKSLTDKHGMEFGRLCITCHEPALAYSNNLSLIYDRNYIENKSEGVSCRSCHYISKAYTKNTWYEVTIPRVDIVFASRKKRQQYIFRAVLEHLRDVSKPAARDGSMCFPCHSLESVRKGKTLIPYDNVISFLTSPYSSHLKCHDCHMPRLVEDDIHHYTWKDHRMFGSQHHLSRVAIISDTDKEKTLRQVNVFEKETVQWMTGKLTFIDMVPTLYDETVKSYRIYNYLNAYKKLKTIYHVLQSSEPLGISLERHALKKQNPSQARTLELTFSLLNHSIGHDYPSSLFANISKTWIEFSVLDCNGRMLKDSLGRKTQEHILGRIEIKDDGKPIQPWESKEYTKIVNKEYLQPLKKYNVTFHVPISKDACAPYTASLSVKNKRYRNDYVHWMLPDSKTAVKPDVIARKTFVVNPSAESHNPKTTATLR